MSTDLNRAERDRIRFKCFNHKLAMTSMPCYGLRPGRSTFTGSFASFPVALVAFFFFLGFIHGVSLRNGVRKDADDADDEQAHGIIPFFLQHSVSKYALTSNQSLFDQICS
jgi:hypothetical protein